MSNYSVIPSLPISIPSEYSGKRLDRVLADLFPEYSRSCLQNWLKQGYITVNGAVYPAKFKVQGEEVLLLDIPEQEPVESPQAEAIDLEIVFEDAELIIVNKPAAMVVHPAAGNLSGTLQNALLYHYPELAVLPRAGLVHRIDKDTSGLLMVARNLRAHKSLVDQLQQRTIHRQYDAITQGNLITGGVIDQPIGRHPVDRKKMTVRQGGKLAITHYRIAEKFRLHTHLKVKLETGRTHQIRVHMAHIKKPLIGDPVYGGRLKIPTDCSHELHEHLRRFKRQALHASELGLVHPTSGEPLQWQASIPTDMQDLLVALQNDNDQHG